MISDINMFSDRGAKHQQVEIAIENTSIYNSTVVRNITCTAHEGTIRPGPLTVIVPNANILTSTRTSATPRYEVTGLMTYWSYTSNAQIVKSFTTQNPPNEGK